MADELTKIGVEAHTLSMPDTEHPRCNAWVGTLKAAVGTPMPNDIFVGHSLGPMAIFRYLENLSQKIRVAGVISVAGFASGIKEPEIESFFRTELNFENVKTKVRLGLVAINSDNDKWVPWEKAEELKNKFGSKLIRLHNAGHINEDAGYTQLPEALDRIKIWAK